MLSEQIQKLSHEYSDDPVIQKAFLDGALAQKLDKPKPTKGANFIIVSLTPGKQLRFEDGDLTLWLEKEWGISLEAQVMRMKTPLPIAIKTFLEKRCGDKFKDADHLYNSVKKHWREYVPEEQQAKPTTRKQIITDSFVDEQFNKRKG